MRIVSAFRVCRGRLQLRHENPAAYPTPIALPDFPQMNKCTRCGSKQTEARPEWPGRDG